MNDLCGLQEAGSYNSYGEFFGGAIVPQEIRRRRAIPYYSWINESDASLTLWSSFAHLLHNI
jgi:hypothetical protein